MLLNKIGTETMPKLRCLPIKVFRKRVFRFKYCLCLIVLVLVIVNIYWFAQQKPYPFEEGQENVNSLLTNEEYRKIFQPFLSSVQCNRESNTLVAINSATPNLQRRQAIRETWAKWVKEQNQTILFFVSRPNDQFLAKEVELENYFYKDIVILSGRETYYLLTFKMLSIINWSLVPGNRCANIRFLVKCDDDLAVNWPKLNKFLSANQNRTNTIFGKLNRSAIPNRDKHSRWYMPEELFASEYYPEFADGPMYILTVDLLPKLLEAASQVKPLYLEDVYITGFLREHVGGKLVYLKELVKYRYIFVPTHCLSPSSISHHKISANEQKDIFEHYASTSDQNTPAFCSLFSYYL